MSRLLHELTNHLTVIAGNVQFFEASKDQPAQLATVFRSLRKVSDALGETVNRYADFRRQLGNDAPVVPLAELGNVLETTLAAPPTTDWQLIPAAPLRGWIRADLRCLAHCVRDIILLAGTTTGEVRIHPPDTPLDPRGLKRVSRFSSHEIHLLVSWPSEAAVFSDLELHQPAGLRLAVVLGLLRWMGGQVNAGFFPPGENRFWISLPLQAGPTSDEL
jgi:hypothetical protein